MNVNDYQTGTPHQRILEAPGMWVGECTPSKQCLYGLVNGKIIPMETMCPKAFQRIYMEVFGNAIDNVGRSRNLGIDPGIIDVTFTERSVTVYNEGATIPIGITPSGMYAPELCFGVVLAGTSYKGKRVGSGINGIGAKATNIFSHKFSVVINSVQNQATYTQHWAQNMFVRSDPTIVPFQGNKGTNMVYFEPDFARFHIPCLLPEFQAIFAFFSLCGAMAARVPLSINTTPFPVLPLKDFVRQYIPVDVKNNIYMKKEGRDMFYEIIIFECKESYDLAFVNGLYTPGGIHVVQTINAFCSYCVRAISDIIGKGKKDKVVKGIDNRSVRSHIGYIINAWLPDPSWDSQAKLKLTSYRPDENAPPLTTFCVEFPETDLQQVKRWNLLTTVIENYTNSKVKAGSKKKLAKRQILKKCTHANFASGNWDRRSQCTLIVTEGDSAVGYFKFMKEINPLIMDTYGVLRFRGKCLNVYNATPMEYYDNKEFELLTSALNLSAPGTDYTIEENFRTLRYAHFLIMADSDVDGNHIKALLLTFFFCKYPTLFLRGFVQIYLTPILRATRGAANVSFYNASTYRRWLRENGGNMDGWKVRYYKGLGTSNIDDVRRDCSQPRKVTSVLDESAPTSFRLNFSVDCADMRKLMIYAFDPYREYEAPPVQPVSDFLKYELIEYSVDNLNRSIPSLMDGQKRVQRKIMFGLLKKKENTFSKVVQLALLCAKRSGYHNGDSSISDALIGMCETYVGSNNLPLIQGSGSFATRDGGSKDAAAARYPDARLATIVSKIFRDEDNELLVPTVDECQKWEPETYFSTLCLALVNGETAIGTGYNTFIPNHRTEDVINWTVAKLTGQTPQDIKPWYRGYKGEIVVESVSKKRKGLNHIPSDVKEWALSNPEVNRILQEIDSVDSVNVFISRGNFQYDPNTGNILITELPIYTLVDKYKKFLGELIEEGKITDYRCLSAGDNIHIEIYGWRNVEPPSHKNLELQYSRTLSNMYLLDSRKMPKYYPTTTAILEDFYKERLAKYLERKKIMLHKILQAREELIVRRKYIRAVIYKEIDIFASEDVFRDTLQRQGIPFEVSKKVRSNGFLIQAVEKLDAEIYAKEQEYHLLNERTPEHLWYLDLQELHNALQK